MFKKAALPAPRIPLELSVRYRRSYGRRATAGTLKNISLTGAFLETQNLELAPRDKVILELTVADRQRKVTATIIWKNGQGCGVRFEPFNTRDVQLVDDLMYFVQSRRDSRRELLASIFEVAG